MKPSEILKAGLERLGENGENWSGFNNKDDHRCECMTTCLIRVSPDWNEESAALDVFQKLFNTTNLGPIWRWNDTRERTFPEVKAKFIEAIALAEQVESKEAAV